MTVFISDCNSNIFHVKASMCTNHIVALNRTYIHKSNGNHTFFSMFWVSTFFIAKMPSKHWFSVCILCYSISGLVGFSSLCVTYIYRFTHPIHTNLHFFLLIETIRFRCSRKQVRSNSELDLNVMVTLKCSLRSFYSGIYTIDTTLYLARMHPSINDLGSKIRCFVNDFETNSSLKLLIKTIFKLFASLCQQICTWTMHRHNIETNQFTILHGLTNRTEPRDFGSNNKYQMMLFNCVQNFNVKFRLGTNRMDMAANVNSILDNFEAILVTLTVIHVTLLLVDNKLL